MYLPKFLQKNYWTLLLLLLNLFSCKRHLNLKIPGKLFRLTNSWCHLTVILIVNVIRPFFFMYKWRNSTVNFCLFFILCLFIDEWFYYTCKQRRGAGTNGMYTSELLWLPLTHFHQFIAFVWRWILRHLRKSTWNLNLTRHLYPGSQEKKKNKAARPQCHQ